MKKLGLSFSNIGDHKWLKISDIIQVSKYNADFVELENGKMLESMHDGRFYEVLDGGKHGNEWQVVELCNYDSDGDLIDCVEIGYIEL